MVGFTGSGKSIRGQWLAKHWIGIKDQVFIYDPNGAWAMWGDPVYSASQVGQAVLDGKKLHRVYSNNPDDLEDLISLARSCPNSLLVVVEPR